MTVWSRRTTVGGKLARASRDRDCPGSYVDNSIDLDLATIPIFVLYLQNLASSVIYNELFPYIHIPAL